MFLLLVSACVALDITAPYEPAVTLLLHVTHPCLVASSATQEAAAIRPHACAITQATPRPQNSHPVTDKNALIFTKGPKMNTLRSGD